MNTALKLAETNESKEITYILTETILPNRSQPRTSFESESLHRLAESIRKYGILQPLTVRKLPEDSEYSVFKYELIAGERRLRASKLLEMPKVPCLIIETDTQTSAALAIIENLHRDDLNIFEEASAIASLIEIHKLTQEDIAQQLSLTQAAIANKLRLLRLSGEEKRLILEHNLTERHARALLRVKNADERTKILSYIIKYSLNVKQTEEYIEKILYPKEAQQLSLIPDYRCLITNIAKAIENTRNNGVRVKTAQTETEKEIIYTISITKPEISQ